MKLLVPDLTPRFFLWKAFKYLWRSDRDIELDFQWELTKLEEILKAFPHQSPPFIDED